MPEEPATKSVIAFFDGQNLFHMAAEAFGHNYPNYDPKALSAKIAAENNWTLTGVRFYTGIPNSQQNHSGIIFGMQKSLIWGDKASRPTDGS
jgi:hypothetical protein